MRLGLNIGYWGAGTTHERQLSLAVDADRLGYDCVWAAEAYGSDAVSVLAWVGARTERVAIGSAVLQIPARTPAMTAMTAATLDTLSGGRFRLGLGVSGPQVSEGWHGVRFAQPLARTREYVALVRQALAREVVQGPGPFYPLPLPDGPGKALRLTIRPAHDIPIYLAAVGPKNLELAGEIADGWHAIFFSPEHAQQILAPLRAGLQRRPASTASTDGTVPFDVVASVPVSLDDDLERAADAVRPYCALYIGGMGSREKNFYNQLARRMGFAEAADRIQELYLAGRPRDAAAAVPFELVDSTALIGPAARVRERLERYRTAGVSTVSIAPLGDLDAARRAVAALAP